MNGQPLVSIITPFLNAERFIQEAIESVIAQTYDNWELLLVDDGSTDTSTQSALRFVEQYAGKAHYLDHQGHRNKGRSASRNLGINYAKGEYIAFLDADDVWLPEKLKRQVEIMESQHNAAMVYGPTQIWNSWKHDCQNVPCDRRQKLHVRPNTLMRPPTLLSVFLEMESATPCTCSLLVRNEVIKNIGGFEETFHGMYDDQAFYAKICLNAPVYVSDECLDKYRRHPDSCCSTAKRTGEYYSARLTFLNWIAEYLSKANVNDKEIWKILQRQLWPYRYPILAPLLSRSLHFIHRSKLFLLYDIP